MQQLKWDLFRDSFLILCTPRLYWDRWPTGHRIHRGLRLIEHFFTSGIWQDGWASFRSCEQSNILPSMVEFVEVWRANVWIDGKESREMLRNSGDTKLTSYFFHFFAHFLCMCVIKQLDDPLQLDWGPQSVSPTKANILNLLQTEHWPFFWAHFYRKPSVLKSHSVVWSTQGPPAQAPC